MKHGTKIVAELLLNTDVLQFTSVQLLFKVEAIRDVCIIFKDLASLTDGIVSLKGETDHLTAE